MAPKANAARYDGDVTLNKINLALAKTPSFLANIHRTRKPSNTSQKSDAEVLREEQDEQEYHTALPELLGFGAKIPDDGSVKRQDLSGNEKLRQQFFGKDYDRKNHAKNGQRVGEGGGSKSAVGAHGVVPPKHAHPVLEADSDDDAGRTALGKVKRKRPVTEDDPAAAKGLEEEEKRRGTGRELTTKSSERIGRSYLDEVIAERAAKKRKKKVRNRQNKQKQSRQMNT